MRERRCQDCGARIYWARSASGKAMPLVLADDGNVLVELATERAVVYPDHAATLRFRDAHPLRFWAATYASHHADCPAGESRRGRPRPHPGQGTLL
jgi:hypothetical protein